MRGIASLAQEHELSLGKPVDQDGHQLACQVRGGLMPAVLCLIQRLRTIPSDQHGQGPSPPDKGEGDRDRQDNPAVPPAEDHVLTSRPDGIMMTALAVDARAAMLGGGVVPRDQHGLLRREPRDNGHGQDFPQGPQRSRRPREDAVVGTGMSGDHAAQGAQDPGDGSTSHRQDGSHCQEDHAAERWCCEGDGKTHENRTRGRWKREHNGLLSDSFTFVRNKRRQESASLAGVSAMPQFASKNGRSRAKVLFFLCPKADRLR